MKTTQDLHVHTHLSICAEPFATPEAYIEKALEIGLTSLGIADHLWDSAVPLDDHPWKGFYGEQNYAHTALSREEFAKIDTKGIRILFGAEGEYDPVNHGIGLTEEVCQKLDFLLIPNSHTHMMMPKDYYEPKQKHADFMLKAYFDIINCPLSGYITSIAHPFAAVACKPYPSGDLYPLISYNQYKEAFDAAKEKSIAFEINTSGLLKYTKDEIKSLPRLDVFRIAKECGCKFTFGSDAHQPESLESIRCADLLREILKLTDEDILTI
ncbi:MAG: PHP domain-containing protein [Clostridia bacterium]|nr:PHP domain-containing protein [Clostridia bacterium]MBQ4157436.1 PHP domain-containing protein [Clostridia bacterium]